MTKQHTRKEIASILALRDREGLSYAELSRRTGVRKSTLAWWGWRGRKEQRSRAPFVEIAADRCGTPTAASAGCGIEIETGTGLRVRLPRDVDADTLTRVLRALAASC